MQIKEVSNIMNLLNFSATLQDTVKGIIIIGAILLNSGKAKNK